MKSSEWMAALEQAAPREFACEWDSVGLLVGDAHKEVNKVYIALDATDEVIEEAAADKADMLLTHHPLLFRGIKHVTSEDFTGRRVMRLIQSDMVCYAMHTNFDVCVMADLAAQYLELEQTEILEETGLRGGKPCGIGKVGMLHEAVTLQECAKLVKERFATEPVKVFGESKRSIQRAAVCPGSGRHDIEYAIQKGAQVLITGDIDHHDGIDAAARGLSIIDAGHYGLEHIFVSFMAQYLQRQNAELQIIRREHKSPFLVI